jgi:hypothetical protein
LAGKPKEIRFLKWRNIQLKSRLLFTIGLVMAAASSPAGATTLNFTFGGTVSGGGIPTIPITGPGTYSGTGLTVTISGAPTPTVTADQSLSYVPSTDVSHDSAFATYEFEYMYTGGGVADASIPVSFHVILDASDCSQSAPTYCGIAAAAVNIDNGLYSEAVICNVGVSAGCAATTDAHSDHIVTLNLAPDVVHTVTVSASTQGFGPAHAMADPYIFLDPGFGDAGSYQLAIPAGVSNIDTSGSATPEPGTLGMLAFGGLLIAVVRARRA